MLFLTSGLHGWPQLPLVPRRTPCLPAALRHHPHPFHFGLALWEYWRSVGTALWAWRGFGGGHRLTSGAASVIYCKQAHRLVTAKNRQWFWAQGSAPAAFWLLKLTSWLLTHTGTFVLDANKVNIKIHHLRWYNSFSLISKCIARWCDTCSLQMAANVSKLYTMESVQLSLSKVAKKILHHLKDTADLEQNVLPEQKLLVLMVLLEWSELTSHSLPSSSERGESDRGDSLSFGWKGWGTKRGMRLRGLPFPGDFFSCSEWLSEEGMERVSIVVDYDNLNVTVYTFLTHTATDTAGVSYKICSGEKLSSKKNIWWPQISLILRGYVWDEVPFVPYQTSISAWTHAQHSWAAATHFVLQTF